MTAAAEDDDVEIVGGHRWHSSSVVLSVTASIVQYAAANNEGRHGTPPRSGFGGIGWRFGLAAWRARWCWSGPRLAVVRRSSVRCGYEGMAQGADLAGDTRRKRVRAPPPTLLVLAPFAILPFGLPLLILTCFVGAAATIRVLRLPWWWVLFPPLVECSPRTSKRGSSRCCSCGRAPSLSSRRSCRSPARAAWTLASIGSHRCVARVDPSYSAVDNVCGRPAGHHRVLPRPDTLRAANGDTADLAACTWLSPSL